MNEVSHIKKLLCITVLIILTTFCIPIIFTHKFRNTAAIDLQENDENNDVKNTDENNVNEEYIITFPEKLYVGQNIDPHNVIKMLTSNGDIRGDVGYMINDDKSEYRIIGGKRIINLSAADLKTESEKVIYPIEITIKNNVITNIQMIFVDQ